MRKPSTKRLGVLRMLRDDEESHKDNHMRGDYPGCYLSGQTSHSLEKYGLTFWDLQSITMARKAGLITLHVFDAWAKLTDDGRAMLGRYG